MALGGMMGPMLGGAVMGDRGGFARPMLPALIAGMRRRNPYLGMRPIGEGIEPGLPPGEELREWGGRRPVRGRPPIVGMLSGMMGRRPLGSMFSALGGAL